MDQRYSDEPEYLVNLRTIERRVGTSDLCRNEPLARRYWGLHLFHAEMTANPRLPQGFEKHAQWLLEREAEERGATLEDVRTGERLREFFERATFDQLLRDDEFLRARELELPLDRGHIGYVSRLLEGERPVTPAPSTAVTPAGDEPSSESLG